jgi:hypothetical protein
MVLFIGLVKEIVDSDRGLRSWLISLETWKVDRFP